MKIHNTNGTRQDHGDSLTERISWAVLTAALSGMAIVAFQHYVDTKYDLTRRVEAVESGAAASKARADDALEWMKRIDSRLDGIEGSLRRK